MRFIIHSFSFCPPPPPPPKTAVVWCGACMVARVGGCYCMHAVHIYYYCYDYYYYLRRSFVWVVPCVFVSPRVKVMVTKIWQNRPPGRHQPHERMRHFFMSCGDPTRSKFPVPVPVSRLHLMALIVTLNNNAIKIIVIELDRSSPTSGVAEGFMFSSLT